MPFKLTYTEPKPCQHNGPHAKVSWSDFLLGLLGGAGVALIGAQVAGWFC